MSDILIRGLNQRLVQRLKTRAKRNGRSLQSEAKMVLENAATEQAVSELLKNARSWRKKLGRKFSDSAELIREDRER